MRFSGEQIFSFSTNTGELDITNFGRSSAHAFRFPCARVATFRRQNWERKVQVNTKVSMNLFVFANTHQGGECFSIESKGQQCAFMSLSASLAAECIPLNEWSQSTINNVLLQETICIQRL